MWPVRPRRRGAELLILAVIPAVAVYALGDVVSGTLYEG